MDKQGLVQVTLVDGKVFDSVVSTWDQINQTITFLDPQSPGMLGKDGKVYKMAEVAAVQRYRVDGLLDDRNLFLELLDHLRMSQQPSSAIRGSYEEWS